MLNIVIPMAGRGSRFTANPKYREHPKPMIPVHGKPMIQVVVENLKPNRQHRFIFICQNEHIDKYDLRPFLTSLSENVEVIGIDGITDGIVSTILKAKDFINNDDPVMTANSDQWINFDVNDYLHEMDKISADGLIMTMKADEDKWSYVLLDDNGYVTKTVEKQVISDEATTGVYNFKRGKDLVQAAEDMIAADDRVNGEFYIFPVYNYLNSKKVVIYNVGSEYNGMHGLGIPSDLEIFLEDAVSEKVKDVQVAHLDDMIKGWFVGDFDQSLLRTKGFEVAVKEYQKGEKEDKHVHKIAKEITVVVRGKVKMCDRILEQGQMILMEPGVATDFEALEDTITFVVKTPSVIGDKYDA